MPIKMLGIAAELVIELAIVGLAMVFLFVLVFLLLV